MTKLSLILGIIVVLAAIGYVGAKTNYSVHGLEVRPGNVYQGENTRYDQFTTTAADGSVSYWYAKYIHVWAVGENPAVDAGTWVFQETLSADEYAERGKPGLTDAVGYIINLMSVRIDGVPDWMAIALDITIVAILLVAFLFIRGGGD